MKVFKINTDSNNVQLVQPVVEKDLEFFKFDCESRLPSWNSLEVYIHNPKTQPKDFYSMPSGILVCNQRVLDVCLDLFEMAGEILPIQVERSGLELYILNVLQCENVLDYERTIWDYYPSGRKGRILDYKFIKSRIGNESTIFKIPETDSIDIFCFADVKDREDEFYYIYHDNNLTGLIFEEIT